MTSLLLTHLALLTALAPWRCGEIAPLPREIGPWINEIVELPQDQHARVAPLARQQLLKRLCGRARRCDALDAPPVLGGTHMLLRLTSRRVAHGANQI